MQAPTINPLHGFVAATHTPFHADGTLNLAMVERQADHLLRQRINKVFIGGSTGECQSLAVEERLTLAKRWLEVTRGTDIKVIVHVGSNCLGDSKILAAEADQIGALAIACFAPSYFKPRSLADLLEWCVAVAGAAPDLPFYFYDIPSMTGVSLPMPDFLMQAKERIPTLAGLKFSNMDLVAYQLCLHADGGRFDLPFGSDECILAAFALGAKGGVGSTYNFAAALYHKLLDAFQRGDLATARAQQIRSVRLVQLLASFGYMSASKAVMRMVGVDVGPARQPHAPLSPEQFTRLRDGLERLGFFQHDAVVLPG